MAVPSLEPLSLGDAARLVHELQVHQIELQAQTEQLTQSRAEVENLLADYTELYDSAPVGYVSLSQQGAVLRANLCIATMLGVERAALVGREVTSLALTADRGVLSRFLAEAFATGGPARCQLSLPPKPATSNRATEVELTATVRPGASMAQVAVVDITERQRAEGQLRASQKMEAIGRLAGGVAHDFNNLLTVILAHAELGQQALAPGSHAHQDLLAIQAAGESAAALTRQLLAFSRQQPTQHVRFDLGELTRGLGRMLGRLLGSDIELKLDLGAVPIWIAADRSQIEQLVMNLAVNARDAMPNGGHLSLTLSDVELGNDKGSRYLGARPGRYVLMTVSDTGTGMGLDTVRHLFEPFFTTKGKDRGTGFGLSTVYGVVEQSSGDIEVETELGRGTTFRVYLPSSSAPGEAKPAPSPTASAPGSETVLIVEDEEPLLRVAKRILDGAGYSVLTATSGPEALHLCERHTGTIDLVLSDVTMPKMTGPAFVERLLRQRPGIRVLYMSGYAGGFDDPGASLARGSRMVGKPFSVVDLRTKVREALDAPATVDLG